MTHDPLCPLAKNPKTKIIPCQCIFIENVRFIAADEYKRKSLQEKP